MNYYFTPVLLPPCFSLSLSLSLSPSPSLSLSFSLSLSHLSPHEGGGMTKKTRENAIYVTQLPQDVTPEKLAELFGSIGVIKVC